MIPVPLLEIVLVVAYTSMLTRRLMDFSAQLDQIEETRRRRLVCNEDIPYKDFYKNIDHYLEDLPSRM